jgi:hypothetical protein
VAAARDHPTPAQGQQTLHVVSHTGPARPASLHLKQLIGPCGRSVGSGMPAYGGAAWQWLLLRRLPRSRHTLPMPVGMGMQVQESAWSSATAASVTSTGIMMPSAARFVHGLSHRKRRHAVLPRPVTQVGSAACEHVQTRRTPRMPLKRSPHQAGLCIAASCFDRSAGRQLPWYASCARFPCLLLLARSHGFEANTG